MSYDRSGAYAGQDVILSIYFSQNSVPANVFSLGDVLIYNPNDGLVTTIPSADIVNPTTGLYKVTYSIAAGSSAGTWKDVWTNIKFTPIAEYVDSTNFFFVVSESQALPNASSTTVYMYVQYPNGEPQVGIYGYAELLDSPYYLGGIYFTNPTPYGIRATSSSTGYLSWDLPQGARVRFSIPIQKVSLMKQLPSATAETDVYNLEDL